MKYYLLLITCFITTFGKSQTTLVDSFLYQGIMRTYKVYVPSIYNSNNAVPLVLNLHGYTSNMDEQEVYGDFRPIADTANFIIVHPNGVADTAGTRSWSCFGIGTINDVGFLSTLIDTIALHYAINAQRIYSTGFSNGGFMSYELACKLSNRIAAIASVAGSMAVTQFLNCVPSHNIPIMQIHGTDDPTVLYAGDVWYVSADSLVHYWQLKNNCNANPIHTMVPDIVTSDLCSADHYVYNNGMQGSTVEFYKITDGKHTWPGAPINLSVTNMDFSASKEIWRFFNQYSLAPNEVSSLTSKPVVQFTNPVHDYLDLFLQPDNIDAIAILNLSGKVIWESKRLTNHMQIHLPSSGIYFIHVLTPQKKEVYKVLNLN